jgi:hypothetical protein
MQTFHTELTDISTVCLLTQIVISHVKQTTGSRRLPCFYFTLYNKFYLNHSSKRFEAPPLFKMSESHSKSLPLQKFATAPSWYFHGNEIKCLRRRSVIIKQIFNGFVWVSNFVSQKVGLAETQIDCLRRGCLYMHNTSHSTCR